MPSANVFTCGGAVVYQLLCGRGGHIAQENKFATSMKNYCYVIVNTLDRTAVAVDAAWDVKGILDLVKQLEVRLRGCIYTHYHFDHCGGEVPPMLLGGQEVPPLSGAKEVEDAGCDIWAGAADAQTIEEQCKLRRKVISLNDGDAIECGDLMLHILNTPGHTPGSVCVFAAPRCLSPRGDLGTSPFKEKLTEANQGLLITGDTLFVGSCGATHFPGGDSYMMMSTLARLSTMDPEVVVCPGHGYAPEAYTTIGRERTQNESMMMGMQKVPKPLALPRCMACGTGAVCGPKGFVIGRKVRIRGLTSDAGKVLNGQHGVLEFFQEDKGRYAIKLLAKDEEKLLKPENVETATTAGAPEEAAEAAAAEAADAAAEAKPPAPTPLLEPPPSGDGA